MVVDDNDAILELMAGLLETFGQIQVCRCHSASEALTAFVAEPESFEFIVSDLEMPSMNGIELCRQLLTLAPHLKILLATGSSLVTDDAARKLGFCGMLAKPFRPTELRRAVANAGLLTPSNTGVAFTE